MNLDETDIKILDLLQENSALTTKELATKVNLSPTPVFERIKRLEKEGIIKKYTAILDADKLSKGFIVFCNIRLKHHSRELGKLFRDAIMVLDEVTECYSISGEYDFLAKIHVQSMAHYQDFVVNKLGDIECIGNLHSVFVMGTMKQTFALPLASS